jgi:hypothetical protein
MIGRGIPINQSKSPRPIISSYFGLLSHNVACELTFLAPKKTGRVNQPHGSRLYATPRSDCTLSDQPQSFQPLSLSPLQTSRRRADVRVHALRRSPQSNRCCCSDDEHTVAFHASEQVPGAHEVFITATPISLADYTLADQRPEELSAEALVVGWGRKTKEQI